MKGILRKFNLKALLGKVKLVPGKIAGMSGRTKSRIIKVASGVGVAGILLAGVAPSLNDNTEAVLPPVETTQDQDATVDEDSSKEAEDDDLGFSFLSDELNITDINMESILGERIATEVAEAAEGMTPVADVGVDENGNPLTKEEAHAAEETIEGNYFIDSTGTPWVSEEAYNEYIAGQNGATETVVETENTDFGDFYYDEETKTFWESYQAYLDYINGLNNTQDEQQVTPSPEVGTGTENSDGGYQDSTGVYWESYQAYLDYVNGLNNTQDEQQVTPSPEVGTGTENSDGSYQDPTGVYWDSEQDYLDYTSQGENADTSNYYKAPDESYWDSEEQYLEHVNSLNGIQDTGTGDIDNSDNYQESDESDYYLAPDGKTVWASEEEYLEYNNGLNNSQDTATVDNEETYQATVEETYEDTVEETYQDTVEEDNSNENSSSDYFVDPDTHSVWINEEEYNEYVQSQSLANEEGKTK